MICFRQVARSLVLNDESHSHDEEKTLSSRIISVGCGDIRYPRTFFGEDNNGGGEQERRQWGDGVESGKVVSIKGKL